MTFGNPYTRNPEKVTCRACRRKRTSIWKRDQSSVFG